MHLVEPSPEDLPNWRLEAALADLDASPEMRRAWEGLDLYLQDRLDALVPVAWAALVRVLDEMIAEPGKFTFADRVAAFTIGARVADWQPPHGLVEAWCPRA